MIIGQFVFVTGANDPNYTARCEVVEFRKPEELPELGFAAPPVSQVREFLEEKGVQRLALLRFYWDDVSMRWHRKVITPIPKAFWAFEDRDGQWFDQKGQLLTIRAEETSSHE